MSLEVETDIGSSTAAMILVVAIIAIIAVSAKTKLSLVPKY